MPLSIMEMHDQRPRRMWTASKRILGDCALDHWQAGFGHSIFFFQKIQPPRHGAALYNACSTTIWWHGQPPCCHRASAIPPRWSERSDEQWYATIKPERHFHEVLNSPHSMAAPFTPDDAGLQAPSTPDASRTRPRRGDLSTLPQPAFGASLFALANASPPAAEGTALLSAFSPAPQPDQTPALPHWLQPAYGRHVAQSPYRPAARTHTCAFAPSASHGAPCGASFAHADDIPKHIIEAHADDPALRTDEESLVLYGVSRALVQALKSRLTRT